MTKRKGAEERQSRPSQCVGCGEAADGYNYDAPSCFSCKTFFRRTVVSKPVFRGCLKGGLCATNQTVQQCRACRFEKCVNGGMNASLISNNNYQMKPCSNEPCFSKSTDDSSTNELVVNGPQHFMSHFTKTKATIENMAPQLVVNPSRFECKVEMMIQKLLSIEAAHQMLRTSSYTPTMRRGLTIDEFVNGPSKLGNHYEVMCAGPSNPFPVPLLPVEVVVKCRQKLDFTKFDYSARKLWFFQDVVYSVEFIKALPIYNLLEYKSKKILISSALICSNLTSAFYSYIHRSDRTYYPDGGVMTWSRQQRDQAPDSVRLYSGMIAAIKTADLDAQEYALLKMIVVCDPMLDGLCLLDATILRHERERCTKALFSYVLARRGVHKGPAFFTKILSVTNVVMKLTSWEKGQHILAIAMGLYDGSVTPFSEATFHSH